MSQKVPAVSQKASSDDISGTKRGSKDPLVSNRPEKILQKKFFKKIKNGPKLSQMVKNCQIGQNGRKWSKWPKMVKMV